MGLFLFAVSPFHFLALSAFHFCDSVEKDSKTYDDIHLPVMMEGTIDALADFSFRSNIQVLLWSRVRPAQKS
jgi:hypothetical protein